MSDRAPLTPELLDRAVRQAFDHVFPILVKTKANFIDSAPQIDASILGDGGLVMGCVGFLGDIDGFIHLRFSDAFSQVVAGLILGMTPDEIKAEGFELVKDSLGELTNMSVGNFKNGLCDLGYPCKLTLPTIVRGSHLVVPTAKGATRRVYHFEIAGHPLLADLQLKVD
ncbi:MAG: chemotaxis protein CheX [Opitutus sp.]|nr:chemotaxis protein CheX [Opitutus sp.]MCS6247421.1 chemotaxis protein CheX [Opitutus sp.]MCS6275533.1 chemotaxis protein CheX [Opitutus sp.]MCS6276716.1 chemotaxis protein CheX [Opitutus sp.]MCS6301635.1 chemotaxis protein CheX [Opitutus sp.]